MDSQAHAQANSGFVTELSVKLTVMGMRVRDNLEVRSGGVVRGPDRLKKPDHQFFPKPLPEGRNPKWPSMVIEVGHAESGSQLRRDVSWRVNASNGDVKLVLTIHVSRKGTITYCLWHLMDRPARPHKGITAQLRQQATVMREASLSIIASDSLTIPFEHLFLRNPQGTEADIIIEKDTLQSLAEDTWDEMEKLESCKCRYTN